jgi:putative oxidoreductase
MADTFPDPLNIGSHTTLILVMITEVFCSVLLILGIATRPVLIPLIIVMMVALFVVLAGKSLSARELPIHYLASYIVLIIAGAGKYSVDFLIAGK